MNAINPVYRSNVHFRGTFYDIPQTFERVRDYIQLHNGHDTLIDDIFASLYALMRMPIIDWGALIENPEGHGYILLDEFFSIWGVGPHVIDLTDDASVLTIDVDDPDSVLQGDMIDMENLWNEVMLQLENEDDFTLSTIDEEEELEI